MPLDPMMSESLLGTWRNMMKEVQDKGLDSGEDYEQMKRCMDRMEELAQTVEGDQMEAMNSFNGTVMQENLYGDFSDAYGRVLKAEAGGGEATDPDDYDDGALLKQVLDGLRGAIEALRKGKQDALDATNNYDAGAAAKAGMDFVDRNAEQYGLDKNAKYYKDNLGEEAREKHAEEISKDQEENPDKYSSAKEIEVLFKEEEFIKPIEDLIKLGEEPGMTLPRFLRVQIETGMDKAMEGSFATRESLEADVNFYDAALPDPYTVRMKHDALEAWDSMVPSAPFGVPDSFKFQLKRQKVEYGYVADIQRFEAVKKRWDNVIGTMETWIKAHTKYAMGLDPWVMIPDMNERRKAIEHSKACCNGYTKIYEEILEEYFGMKFHDIFHHETFEWFVNTNQIEYSQVYLEFLRDQVYPECIPLQLPSQSIISKWEEMYDAGLLWDPEEYLSVKRTVDNTKKIFGDDFFERKGHALNGSDEPNPERKADKWDLKAFQAGVPA